jgi:sugar (pentulose or hexulose) kinase
MAGLVAGLEIAETGGSATATGWVVDGGGRLLGTRTARLPVRRPGPDRCEFDPLDWWASARSVLAAVVNAFPGSYLGLTVSAARTGFLLTDGRVELGPGVAPSDRRGAGWLDEVRAHRQLYAMTRHWPAAELTLPKLLALRADAPRRWADARRLLFLHDWLIWRLTGAEVTEMSYACAGGLAHVSQRSWASSLLDDLDIPRDVLAPLVTAADVVGPLRAAGLGLPRGLPVVAGCGDHQLTAAGVGAAHRGAVCVLAEADTTLLAGADFAPLDGEQRPLVSTHAPRDTWAVEMPCGSPAGMLGWLAGVLGVAVETLYDLAAGSGPGAGGLSAVVGLPHCNEQTWASPVPPTLQGVDPSSGAAELAAAVTEAYGYAVRANLADLDDVLGHPARLLVLAGAGACDQLAALLAAVTGRDVAMTDARFPAALAGAALVTAAVGAPATGDLPSRRLFPAGDSAPYDEAYARYLAAHETLRTDSVSA